MRFVHDAINYSSKIKTVTYLSGRYLVVKAILWIFLQNTVSLAQVSTKSGYETLILAKGEQIELNFPKILQYSVGNKEVLGTKLDRSNKTLYIKGKSMGFTDLILWTSSKRFTYQVFVISKKNHLEHARILEVFKSPEWKVTLEGNAIALKGEITSQNQWMVLQDLAVNKSKLVLQDVSIDRFLKRELLTKSYKKLGSLGLSNFRCEIQELPHIDCSGQHNISNQDLKTINNSFPTVRWKRIHELSPSKNIRAKLKILSFDLEQGENWQKGLGFLQGQLHQVFEGSFWSMIKTNAVQFRKYWNKVQIVAEPEFILIPNTKAHFTIGSEIPFWSRNSQNENMQLEWKFAGLKVQIHLLETKNPKTIRIQYHTALTSPVGEQIHGHEQEAELHINDNQNTILFDISYQSQNHSQQGIPFWKKIPILYQLFADDFGHANQKKITAVINLTQEDHP